MTFVATSLGKKGENDVFSGRSGAFVRVVLLCTIQVYTTPFVELTANVFDLNKKKMVAVLAPQPNMCFAGQGLLVEIHQMKSLRKRRCYSSTM